MCMSKTEETVRPEILIKWPKLEHNSYGYEKFSKPFWIQMEDSESALLIL